MPLLSPGDEIGIPCEVAPGPFSDEKLVSFDTINGPVTGFARNGSLAKDDRNRWFLRAVVKNIREDVVTVRADGSFFNTNGLAYIKREMALAV